MFTGLIEEVGTVKEIRTAGAGVRLLIGCHRVLEGLQLGDSIAIDGACQTVVELIDSGFEVQSVATTLGRTIIGEYRQGRRVNLERSLALGARLGGHLVQGHVDAVGTVRSLERRDEYTLIDFALPEDVADTTVLHGSIALNGISLTVNDLPTPHLAQVSIIPHTWNHTALSDLAVGERVNLEGDLIGKYVRRLLDRGYGRGG